MSVGTIALTKNSTAVTGTGTAFTTDLKAGDFVVATVGGTAYTLGVLSVSSNTALVLSQAYLGATASGLTWQAVPFATLNLITSALAQQVSYAVRGFNLDKNNWQQVFSGTGNITVNLPDGSSYTGPAWSSITDALNGKADMVSGAVPISQGGTGQKTASLSWKALLDGRTAVTARTDLGLGTAATKDSVTSGVDTTPGRLLQVGSFGIGGGGQGITVGASLPIFLRSGVSQIFRNAVDTSYVKIYSPSIVMCAGDTWSCLSIGYNGSGVVASGGTNSGSNDNIYNIYTDRNTTKTSDGTLKAASPVARIVNSQHETQRVDVAEVGFIWCGCGTANKEAEGVSISRLDTGVYVLAGSAGLASEGWQLLPPRDPHGGGDLGIVEAEQTESGGLKIKLFKRRYKLNDEGDIEVIKGVPIDVPANSWIDVRLSMPDDSAWNKR